MEIIIKSAFGQDYEIPIRTVAADEQASTKAYSNANPHALSAVTIIIGSDSRITSRYACKPILDFSIGCDFGKKTK